MGGAPPGRSGRARFGALRTHPLDLNHSPCHGKPEGDCILGKQSSDPRILKLDRCPATAADEKKAIVSALRMGTWDVGVLAFNLGDEALRHQESKRSVDSGRSDWTRVLGLERFDQFVGACRPTIRPQQFQDVPAERCHLYAARLADRYCQRDTFTR